ncbi:hypothetical protein SNEBB_007389, partial [Seison nebaliae]
MLLIRLIRMQTMSNDCSQENDLLFRMNQNAPSVSLSVYTSHNLTNLPPGEQDSHVYTDKDFHYLRDSTSLSTRTVYTESYNHYWVADMRERLLVDNGEILYILAVDLDDVNEKLEFELLNYHDIFQIEYYPITMDGANRHYIPPSSDTPAFYTNSARIRLVGTPDYHANYNHRYELNVRVTDGGKPPRSSDIIVNVPIQPSSKLDIRWDDSSFNFAVSSKIRDNQKIGKIVFADLNARSVDNLSYEFLTETPNDYIELTRDGELIVKRPLENIAGRTTTIPFTLQKRKNGDIVDEIRNEVVLHIVAVNTKTPTFSSCPDVVEWKENRAVGEEIIKLNVTDGDTGVNGEVTFDIFELSAQGKMVENKFFKLRDPSESNEIYSVKLVANKNFSFDQPEHRSRIFQAIIRARDGGTPSFVGYCTIFVRIIDVNNHRPIFPYTDIEFAVDLEEKTQTARLHANDLDSEENAKLFFFRTRVNGEQDNIRLGSDGRITVDDSIDKDQTYEFTAEVCNDMGRTYCSEEDVRVKITFDDNKFLSDMERECSKKGVREGEKISYNVPNPGNY